MNGVLARPRLVGLVCGAGAVAIGMVYMAAVGAPLQYLTVNLAALILGATAWVISGRTTCARLPGAKFAVLALALPLLLTALFGVTVEGASRWVNIGPLTVQVNLVVLPVMVVLYARRPNAIGTAGMIIAALALAVQPDRAMAGALSAGLLALVFATVSRLAVAALGAAAVAFVWTLLAPDTLPATPYVDRVFPAAFKAHALTGLALTAGAATLVMPGLIALAKRSSEQSVLLAFSGCWAGIVVAAALGNYPTPLVGYGGSAVLGYLLSVALLPNDARTVSDSNALAAPPIAKRRFDRSSSKFRVAV